MATEMTEQATSARILLVDDHQIVRSGLRSLIEFEKDMVVVGEAGTAGEALGRVDADEPDLVVLDVRLPDRSGIAACQEITSRHPDVKVLMLTSHADDGALNAAMTARASGYVLKRVGASDLISIFRRVLGGERIFEHDWETSGPDSLLGTLSQQERAVASLVAEGLTNREIAGRMGLAEKTVKNYVSSILTKMGMSRRSEAAAYVARIEASRGAGERGWPATG